MKKISVVIPVYYNEKSLPPLYAELCEVEQALSKQGLALELIFVDDGSGDNSLQKLMEIKKSRPETRIIKLSRNFGAVHASKAGMQHATGDCCVILAADLQDPPRLILEMAQKWQAGAKYVICVRDERSDPLITRLFSTLYYKLLRLYIVPDYPGGGFDLLLMDRSLLPYLQQSGKYIYTPLFTYWLGFKPQVLRYKRQKRVYGSSRWTFSKKISASLDVLIGFSVVPIRLISTFGLLVSFISFTYGIWIAINAALGKIDVRGFATIVVVVSFLLGLVILMLGVIGEYLWRIFEEVNRRPEVVIDEVY